MAFSTNSLQDGSAPVPLRGYPEDTEVHSEDKPQPLTAPQGPPVSCPARGPHLRAFPPKLTTLQAKWAFPPGGTGHLSSRGRRAPALGVNRASTQGVGPGPAALPVAGLFQSSRRKRKMCTEPLLPKTTSTARAGASSTLVRACTLFPLQRK